MERAVVTEEIGKTWVDDEVRQEGSGGVLRVVVRKHFRANDTADGEFTGADVLVGGWRVNGRRYTTLAGASRRAAREIESARTQRRGHFGGVA
jgi:hypothetical protein